MTGVVSHRAPRWMANLRAAAPLHQEPKGRGALLMQSERGGMEARRNRIADPGKWVRDYKSRTIVSGHRVLLGVCKPPLSDTERRRWTVIMFSSDLQLPHMRCWRQLTVSVLLAWPIAALIGCGGADPYAAVQPRVGDSARIDLKILRSNQAWKMRDSLSMVEGSDFLHRSLVIRCVRASGNVRDFNVHDASAQPGARPLCRVTVDYSANLLSRRTVVRDAKGHTVSRGQPVQGIPVPFHRFPQSRRSLSWAQPGAPPDPDVAARCAGHGPPRPSGLLRELGGHDGPVQ